ncbi:MAG: replicative DNA helicase, partial [Clostridia bacterium]|nr:replicative DNA helicase [Clostridia bacterium]
MEQRQETVIPRGVVPPNSQEAERSVLGAMMQDAQAVGQAAELLVKEDFYTPGHQEIFDAMKALNSQGMPVDLVTVDAELSRRGTLEGVGGTAYLMDLVSYVPTTANVKAYITLVSEKSTLRRLIQAAQAISSECYTQQNPLQETLNHAEKAIFDIVMRRSAGESLVHVKDVLTITYEKIEELAKLKGRIAGVPTGFIDLDNLTTGLHAGELVLVGARPSMGKTSFAMNICQHAALKAGKSTAVFSLEMPREQIAMRMLCSEARVDMQKVRSGTLSDGDWMKLARVLGPMAKAPLYIDDNSGIKPSHLRSRCRRLMMDKGLD